MSGVPAIIDKDHFKRWLEDHLDKNESPGTSGYNTQSPIAQFLVREKGYDYVGIKYHAGQSVAELTLMDDEGTLVVEAPSWVAAFINDITASFSSGRGMKLFFYVTPQQCIRSLDKALS